MVKWPESEFDTSKTVGLRVMNWKEGRKEGTGRSLFDVPYRVRLQKDLGQGKQFDPDFLTSGYP